MIRPSARSNAATCRILRVCRNVMLSSLAALRSFPSCYDPGDPGAVDLLHGEQVAGDAYLVAGLWGASEVAEDEATHSPEVLALEPGAQRPVRLFDWGEAVHRVRAVSELAHGRSLFVELVADLADYLLDDILHGDDPLKGAPLVDDDGHPKAPVLEVLEDGVHTPILGDGQHLAHDLFGPHLRPKAAPILCGAHHVLSVNRSDYPLSRPFLVLVDRVAGVLARGDEPEELPQRHLRRQRDDVGAGDHDLARRRVLKLEDSLQHMLLAGVKDALARRAADDQAQFILRVLLLGFGGRGHPEEPHHGVGGAIEDDYARVEEIVEKPHEGCHEQGGSLRPGDGNALGRELPEDDVQKRYGGEGDGKGDGVG